MSLCLRPVVETWGEGLTYSTRWIDMDDLIAALVQYAGEDTGEGKESVLDLEPLVHETSTYGDMRTVYISDGERFLNWLESVPVTGGADPKALTTRLEADGLIPDGEDDPEELERIVEDLRGMKNMAKDWKKSVDQDRSLRFYCD